MSPTQTARCPRKEAEKFELVRPDLPSTCVWSPSSQKNVKSPHIHECPRGPALKISPDILRHIGNTPLVKLNKLPKQYGIKCEILAKCEYMNAGGSIKDRIALRMITDAEKQGIIKPGYTLIEPTSGNTGIGLALAAAVKGYRCVIVLPEKMSNEKVDILRALGADIVRTPNEALFDSPESHISVAQRLNKEIPNSVILDQYRNPGNPLCHYDITAEEILNQCDNELDMVICGAGTGGTITGIGRKIKEKCPWVEVVGVDPHGSILAQPEDLNKKPAAFYEVEGIGYDFIPTVLDRSVVDKWFKSDDKQSLIMARKLIQHEGLLCGGSSGAAMIAALEHCKKLKEGQRCVIILPDNIRNYMSKFLSDDWMIQRDFIDIQQSDQYWWWNLPVSLLKFNQPLTIPPTSKCQEAIDMMTKGGYDQLPVVDENGKIHGVITLGNILSNMMKKMNPTELMVKDVTYTHFNKIHLDTKLGKLSHLLRKDHFAIIVKKGNVVTKLEIEERVEIIGIITQIDLVHYITNKEKLEEQLLAEQFAQ